MAAEALILLTIGLLLTAYQASVRRQRVRLRTGAEVARRLAGADPLTGLGNRRAFDEALTVEIARCERGRGRWRSASSTWTTSSASTTVTATARATAAWPRSRGRWRARCARAIAAFAGAVTNSWWSCRTPTGQVPRRSSSA